MPISKLLEGKNPSQQVTALKTRRNCPPAPDVADLMNKYNTSGHSINDRSKRPDKAIKEERDVPFGIDKNGLKTRKKEKVIVRFEEVNRTPLPFQKKIVREAVDFMFSIPVEETTESEDEKELAVLKAIKKINRDNKIDTLNKDLGEETLAYKETAEYWYPVDREEPNDDYGFTTKKRLRVVQWSPSKGDSLYPIFDEYGDLIAISREYSAVGEDGKGRLFLDTYTAKYFLHYEQSREGWEAPIVTPNPIGKIPVVYYSKKEVEYEDVQEMIERLEKLLSNLGETNDYHSSPKIFVTGKILGWAKKAEAGAVIEGEKESKAQYLSWDHAPESSKLEYEILIKLIHSLSQTPDISFESLKGIAGDISGVALKLLFMDAHLKANNNADVFKTGFDRRVSIQKSYISMMNEGLRQPARKLEVNHKFTIFMISNDKENAEIMVTANGGKAIISQKGSVKKAAIVKDPEADWEQIEKEADADATRGNIVDAIL